MARPVTLFTGQWADLSFEKICEKAKSSVTTASNWPVGAIISKSTSA